MSECLLTNPDKLLIGKREEGEPPSWIPAFAYPRADVVWLDKKVSDELMKRVNEPPCDICPNKIKDKCTLSSKVKDGGE